MLEKTGVWKTKMTHWIDKGPFAVDEPTPFIEFDFLAVLEKPKDFKIRDWCPGCKAVSGNFGLEIFSELSRRIHIDTETYDERFHREISRNAPKSIDQLFNDCLRKSLVSCCDCFRMVTRKHTSFPAKDTHEIVSTNRKHCQDKCDHCTVYRQTGYLQIATGELPVPGLSANGSFLLEWTSKAKSLLAPRFSSLIRSNQMNTISIHVDFLPAFELLKDDTNEHNHFIVAKRCSLEKSNTRSWRTSYCLLESSIISNEHAKCHLVIKYIFEQLNIRFQIAPRLNGYHGKVAVLNHARECSRGNEHYDKCVVAEIRDLFQAYSSSSLKTYVNKKGDLLRTYMTNEEKAIVMACLLKIFTKIKRRLKIRWRYKPWHQKLYSPWMCIRIIDKMSDLMRM